jgi:UPF0716 family protein affecting phage T7 exclusion
MAAADQRPRRLAAVPGFITDVVGACLLIGPARGLARRLIERTVQTRVMTRAARFSARSRSDYDVDSTARDVDPHHLPG